MKIIYKFTFSAILNEPLLELKYVVIIGKTQVGSIIYLILVLLKFSNYF